MTGPRPEAARRRIPARGIVLGYGPIVPMLFAAVAAWIDVPTWSALAIALARLWGAAILAFVAGVRRGTSFYTPGRPKPDELASALGFFAVAFVALFVPDPVAFALLTIGYLGIAIVDTRAAHRREVPRYFAILRPTQMTLAACAFAALFARTVI